MRPAKGLLGSAYIRFAIRPTRYGIRLLHCKTDVEIISKQTTISKLRER